MFDAAIAALIALLLSAGGWLKEDAFGARGVARYCGLIALLLLAPAPPIGTGAVSISVGAVLTAAMLLLSQRTAYPLRLLFWVFVTGLAAWQLAEWFPLGRWEWLWMLLPAFAIAEAVRGDDAMKRQLLVLSPFVFLLCRALMDRFLFGYASVLIGSGDGLTASLSGLVLYESVRAAKAYWAQKSDRHTGILPFRTKIYPKI